MIPTNKMETEKTSQGRLESDTTGTFCTSHPIPTPARIDACKYHDLYRVLERHYQACNAYKM